MAKDHEKPYTGPIDETDERLIRAFAEALRAEFGRIHPSPPPVSDIARVAAEQYAVIHEAMRPHSERTRTSRSELRKG